MACCAVRLSVLGPLDEGEAGGAFMGDEDALAILGKEHEVGFPMSRHVARAGFGRAFAQRTALLDDVDHGADRKSTRLNSSHSCASRMPSSACKKKLYKQQ